MPPIAPAFVAEQADVESDPSSALGTQCGAAAAEHGLPHDPSGGFRDSGR